MVNKLDCVLVRDNGVLLVEETLDGLRTRLEEIAANESGNLDEIANAVAAVWDEHPAMPNMQLKVLGSYAMNKLTNISASEYETIFERVLNYIRGAGDLYFIARGPGKGVQNLSRLSQDELVKVADQRAKAADRANTKAAKVA